MSVELLPGAYGYDLAPIISPNRKKAATELLQSRKGRKAYRGFMEQAECHVPDDEQSRTMHYLGFTAFGGHLVQVCVNFAERDVTKKYHVVTASLELGKVAERRVIGIENNEAGQSPYLGLYLDGKRRGDEHVSLTNRHFEYDPGAPYRAEYLQDIRYLVPQVPLGRLAVVRS